MGRKWALAAALALAVAAPVHSLLGEQAPPAKAEGKDVDLFDFTRVWTVHLTFTPEQWAAMEPKGSGTWPPPPPQRRGPNAGPPPATQRISFGPSMFLVPTFLSGDADKDGKLSREEFTQLADKWFTQWDKEKTGKVGGEQLRTGLNVTVAAADPNGGRPPGLNLQGREGKRNGLASAMGVEFPSVKADIQIGDQVFKEVGVRYKGNGTWLHSRGSLKRSMKVDLDDFVKDQSIAGAAKLNLHSNATDASLMNEVMSHRLYRDAGVPAPRTSYAKVFVTVPGKHEHKLLGIYSIVENIDKDFAKRNFSAKGGAILKPVTPTPFTDMGDDWADYNQTYDPKTSLSDKEKKRIVEFCKLVSHADDVEFSRRVGEFLDLDAFANYMAVTVYLSTLDGILGAGQNYYVYLHPKTGKLHFMPWDLDHSFGQFFLMGNQDQRDTLSIRKPWMGKNRFLERVYKHEPFYKLYLAKLEQHSKTLFQPERFAQQVDEIAAAIRPGLVAELDTKIHVFDKVVAGESAGPPIPGPMRFMMPGMNTRPIKPFVKARTPSLLAQLSGKAEGFVPEELGFGPKPVGGPGVGFGPGNIVGPSVMASLDTDKSGSLEKPEALSGFARWFESWNSDKSGSLTDQQLRAGIDRDLAPARPNFPGGPAGGPAGAPPSGPPGAPPRVP